MTKKTILIIGLISLLFTIKTFSQAIVYGYDDNGNRNSRTIYLGPPINKIVHNNDSTAVKDSLNSIAETILNEQDKPIEITIANNSVSIYPNPVAYYLMVDIKEIADSKVEIIISDEFGKTSDKIIATNNSNKIDFSQKARGVYFIKIKIDGKSESWKIIKE